MKNLNSTLLLSLFLLFHTANAFNITRILNQYPDFSTFNNYLTQTQLAGDINGRQTITILVVDNGGMSELSSKPTRVLKRIMSVHVVLDYYDVPKLKKLSKKSALLTTLFQSSGQASGQQGFVNVTDLSGGEVAFGSAVRGSTLGANLVKSVVSQPYNISVLQISSVIIPTGIENTTAVSPSKSPASSPTPSKAPTPAETPTPGSPPKPSAAEPTADSPAAPAADAPKNGAAGILLGLSISVFMIVVSTLCLVSMI